MNQRSAFTLVELSIVLVIIGLLVGGVLGGQSLIRSAGIRSTIGDIQKYSGAWQQFQTEFNALPGDMSTASTVWGAADAGTGSTAACYSASKAGSILTCNGNGDGILSATNPATAAVDGTEDYLVWQHLTNAGLITGNFTGKPYTANYGTLGGTNVPAGKITGLMFVYATEGYCASSDLYLYDGCYGNIVAFGSNQPAQWGFIPMGILTPAELYSIDKKIDDGLPGFGQLRAFKPAYQANCTTDANNYNLGTAANGPNCGGFYGVDPIK